MTSSVFDELIMHNDDNMVIDNSFRDMIGCLYFLTHQTRPDLATAIGIFSQDCIKRDAFIVKIVLPILGNSKGTWKFGLQFNLENKSDEILELLSDTHFDENKNACKSWSEFLAKAFGYRFLWNHKRQKCVFLLTPGAEYNALCDTICDLKFLWNIFPHIGFTLDNSTQVRCDNSVSNMWANSVNRVKRSMHKDMKTIFWNQWSKKDRPMLIMSEQRIMNSMNSPNHLEHRSLKFFEKQSSYSSTLISLTVRGSVKIWV